MPIYVYECQNCAGVFEVMQRMADEPLQDCPDGCGGHVRKLVVAPILMGLAKDSSSQQGRPGFT